ncbi:MAG: TonB-dependent receptor [candidate division WOR-3 bacterium]
MEFLFFVISVIDSLGVVSDTIGMKRYISEGIVVTATRYNEDISDISASISVIGEGDIKFANSYVSPDLLIGVTGVEVMKTGNFGRADVVIRGIGNNGRRLGFFINGRPEKMSIFSCAVTHTFPLHNVKKIEVFKGPLSSLYGSGAMGGVVNILTNSAEEENKVEFEVDYGSFNTRNLTTSFRESFGKLSFLGGAQKNSSDGHLPNSASRTDSYEGDLIYDFNKDWKIDTYLRYVDTYQENPPAFGDTVSSKDYQWYRRGSFDFSISGKINEMIESETKLYRTFGFHKFSDGWNSEDKTDGISSSFLFPLIEGNRTQGGIEFYRQDGFWVAHNEWVRNVYECFFHTQQKTSFFNISGGLRYTYSEQSRGIFSYDGGFVLKIKEMRIRTRLGKGFRLPAFNDLYLYPSSNPFLKPEELWSWEVGLRQKISKIIDFDFSLYYLETDNFIRFSSISKKFENIDSLREKGMETSLGFYPMNWLYLELFYSYIDRGNKTQGIPGQKWSGNLTFEKNFLEARLSGRYITDYYAQDDHKEKLPSYSVFDFHLNIKPKPYLYLSLGIDNIFNRDYLRYVEIPARSGIYEMPGRSFKIGIVLRK